MVKSRRLIPSVYFVFSCRSRRLQLNLHFISKITLPWVFRVQTEKRPTVHFRSKTHFSFTFLKRETKNCTSSSSTEGLNVSLKEFCFIFREVKQCCRKSSEGKYFNDEEKLGSCKWKVWAHQTEQQKKNIWGGFFFERADLQQRTKEQKHLRF